MTETERELLEYAIESPDLEACKTVVLGVIHGCVGASNLFQVRSSADYIADAKRLGVEHRTPMWVLREFPSNTKAGVQ